MADIKALNKSRLMAAILARLREDHALFIKAARAAHAEATDEQSKAESKYDTRGLEAGYLAMGQGRKIGELEADILALEKLGVPQFTPTDPIDVGAAVELKSAAGTSHYLIAPRAGGLELVFEGREIWVITPQSPIGSLLVGRRKGSRFRFGAGTGAVDYTIETVL